jgi:hypothetical protein
VSGEGKREGESTTGEPTVMAAVDRTGETTRLVIADVSGDDRWLSIPHSEAPMLRAWR